MWVVWSIAGLISVNLLLSLIENRQACESQDDGDPDVQFRILIH